MQDSSPAYNFQSQGGDVMRIILCLLALVAAPAWAEWVEVSEADGLVSYIDPATILRNGNFRKVWQVQDLKQRGSGGELSREVVVEYDCKEMRQRILSITGHVGPMAGGETLLVSREPDGWQYIPPKTPNAAIFKIVCAK
jgi:hypothetical protein